SQQATGPPTSHGDPRWGLTPQRRCESAVLSQPACDSTAQVSPVVRVGGRGWLILDARLAALTAALYTIERCGLVTPWVVAIITFMALEAVCCIYSNVLRDHINKILALWGVMKFYRNIRSGVTFKDPEAIEL
ncbi:hypothetical protein Hamer_G001742, partial [Homarus americanus]